MTPEEAAACEEIRRATYDYMAAADAFFSDESPDFENVLAQLADDVILEFAPFGELPGFSCKGKAEVRAMFGAWIPPSRNPDVVGSPFVRHNITTCQIKLTGTGTAMAKTYFMVMTDLGPDHAGNYEDTLVKQGDRWVFGRRRISLLWRRPDGRFPPQKRV